MAEGGLRKNSDYGCFEKERGCNPRLFASGWLEVLLQPLLYAWGMKRMMSNATEATINMEWRIPSTKYQTR